MKLKNVWLKWDEIEAYGNVEIVLVAKMRMKFLIFKNCIGNVLFKSMIFDKSFVTKCKNKTFTDEDVSSDLKEI